MPQQGLAIFHCQYKYLFEPWLVKMVTLMYRDLIFSVHTVNNYQIFQADITCFVIEDHMLD